MQVRLQRADALQTVQQNLSPPTQISCRGNWDQNGYNEIPFRHGRGGTALSPANVRQAWRRDWSS